MIISSNEIKKVSHNSRKLAQCYFTSVDTFNFHFQRFIYHEVKLLLSDYVCWLPSLRKLASKQKQKQKQMLSPFLPSYFPFFLLSFLFIKEHFSSVNGYCFNDEYINEWNCKVQYNIPNLQGSKIDTMFSVLEIMSNYSSPQGLGLGYSFSLEVFSHTVHNRLYFFILQVLPSMIFPHLQLFSDSTFQIQVSVSWHVISKAYIYTLPIWLAINSPVWLLLENKDPKSPEV